MKISNKIVLLIFFILLMLAVNTFIGLRQLSKIGVELKNIVNQDIPLMETITSISQHQLEKAILLERVLRIAEEIAFEEIPVQRKEYLLSYINLSKTGFDDLSNLINEAVDQSKIFLEYKLQNLEGPVSRDKLQQATKTLLQIEKDHVYYDTLVKQISESIKTGDYQLSIEDVDKIERGERKLTRDIKDLLAQVQEIVRGTLALAETEERFANRILWSSLLASLWISLIVVFLIIRSIVRPLKDLVLAAHQIGGENFNIQLKHLSRDEIGEVSAAFNVMTDKLQEKNKALKEQRDQLAKNLEVTENQKKDLERINQELDDLIHIVSHDIRTPLTGIVGYSALLEEEHLNKLDERGQKSLSGLHRGVERLNAMVNDLLALSRISRLQNTYEEVDIKQLVNATIKDLEIKIKQCKASVTIESDMPSLQCDRTKMKAVFFHLINNAVKFSFKDQQNHPEVRIGCQDKEGRYEFYVKDNGIGISAQDQNKIFTLFKRLHPSDEYEGTGAGLSIVKKVIDSHHGKIWLEAQPGQGTTFYFTIPKNLKVASIKILPSIILCSIAILL